MSNLFKKLRSRAMRQTGVNQDIVVVSGLPRSGTSMMMKMLEAGGMSVLSDGLRSADIDNPKGYYEFERVKQLPKGDVAWLPDARGKVVKIIAALLEYLPLGYTYRVILMQRRMEEILVSQRKMLARRGEAADTVNDTEMALLFSKHLEKVRAWLTAQPRIAVLDVDYNVLLVEPEKYATGINTFLGGHLDGGRMVDVVDPQLYRNRATQS